MPYPIEYFPDPQPEPEPIAVCGGCGEEIMPWEETIRLNNGIYLHDEYECRDTYLRKEFEPERV